MNIISAMPTIYPIMDTVFLCLYYNSFMWKEEKKLVFTFENTRSHGVCARCVRSFNFSFPFRLFAFNVEFVFYVSVSLTDDAAAAVLREQEMHRLTNENLILFQGECCNANNVFFSFLLLLLQTGFLFYAQLHRRWTTNECVYTQEKEIKIHLRSASAHIGNSVWPI